MTELKLKSGVTLSYDPKTNKISENGKPTTKYEPVFVPAGNDDPDFFGFLEKNTQKVFDVYGNESKLSKYDVEL